MLITKRSQFRYFLMLVCLCTLVACSSSTEESAAAPTSGYYSLQSFFKKEVDSLSQHNPTVHKTVGIGEEQEVKTVHIKDWNTELGVFLAVDLSKPAYDGQYSVDSTAQQITYTALSDEVDVQSLSISFDAKGQVASVKIEKSDDNFLYQNKEELTYLRGESYTIFKEQHILLLGTNQYKIVGSLLPK